MSHLWLGHVIGACVLVARASIGEEDTGLQLAGELLCLLCVEAKTQQEIMDQIVNQELFIQIHQSVLGCLLPAAGAHTGNYLKRVIPVVYYHQEFQQLPQFRELLGHCWTELCRAVHTHKENSSIVACLLFDLLVTVQTTDNTTIWDIAYEFVNDSAPILRKRGLYVIERLVASTESTSPQVAQWRQWITAYEAVTGATQLHIVEQMWPTIVQLSNAAANPDASQNASELPLLSSNWINLLFNILIIAGASSIRRITLTRILRRHVGLSLDNDFAHWVCDRLLPALDQPSYFKKIDEARIDTDESRLVYNQFTRTAGEGVEQDVAKGEYNVPGVYLRSFVSAVLAEMTVEHRCYFLKHLIQRVCADKIVHTVNLMLDVFSPFAEVLPLNCLELSQLEILRSYLGERVLASNTTLFNAIGDTFVPLICAHTQSSVPLQLISKGLSKFTWADCFQRWVPELHRTVQRHSDGNNWQTTDFLGIFTPLLLLDANRRGAEYIAAVVNTVERMHYEPYISERQQAVAVDALLQIVNPVLDAVRHSHAASPEGAFRSLVCRCADLVLRLADSLVPIAQSGLQAAETAIVNSTSAVIILQGLACSCACVEVLVPQHGHEGKFHTIVHGIATAVNQLLPRLTPSGEVTWGIRLSSFLALREMLHTAADCVKFVQVGGGPNTMMELYAAEMSPQLPVIVHNCRTLKPPSKREYGEYSTQCTEGSLYFDRFSDMCRAYLGARWGAQAYCSQLGAVLGSQDELVLGSALAIEECVDAFEIVSEDTVYLVCLCLEAVLRATLVKLEPTEKMQTLVTLAIERAWQSCKEVTVNAMEVYYEFIHMAFNPIVLQFMSNTEFHKELFDAQLELGLSSRPHSLRILVGHMCGVWIDHPTWMIPYLSSLTPLLVYKEPDVNDAQTANIPIPVVQSEHNWAQARRAEVSTQSTFYNSPTLRFVVRFVLLHVFEKMHDYSCNNHSFAEAVRQQVVLPLLEWSNSPELTKAAMIGTEEYNQKLRIWQALCVLARYIDESIAEQVNEQFWSVVKHICAHGIRFHVETFGCMLALRFPQIVLPNLFQEILCFSHKGQIISSMFIMTGYTLLTAKNLLNGTISAASYPVFPELTASPAVVLNQLPRAIQGILPYLGSVQGFTRVIAQLLLYEMLKDDPRIVSASENDTKTPDLELSYIRECWRYLHENTEMKRVRDKQEHFFDKYQPLNLCSLAGLALVPFDEFGELCPVHLLTVVSQCLKEVNAELKEDDEILLPVRPVLEQHELTSLNALQRKIVPFDALQLEVEAHVITRSLNELGRRRQQLVVCASLIDKVPNLAGLARTCEIFAVEKLTIPNKTIAEHDQFKSIAVSAQDWVPIEEVKEDDIVHFLRAARKEGYTIVGLEQTGESKLIQDAPIEERMVLVLGKEKEGIPVEILQEVDYCIEIPQFGVTRSLNVHVSAALAIWEYTRKQLLR